MTRYSTLLCLSLGAAAALGFAPLDWWPLALFAISLWMQFVHDARSIGGALWRGWTFGVGHFTVNNNWIGHAFDFQDAMPSQLGYLAPPALALYLAVYPMLAAGLVWRLASPRAVGDEETALGWPFVLTFSGVWVVAEYLRATMFTGYAWDPLGVQWLSTGIAHAARWLGTYALSGLFMLAAGSLLLASERRRSGWAALVGFIAAGFALTNWFGFDRAASPAPPDLLTPRIRIVQPNIAQDQRGDTDGELMLSTLEKLSGRPGPAPRLILWPEGVVRDFIEDGYPWQYYLAPTGRYGDAEFNSPKRTRARLSRLLGPRDLLLFGGSALNFDANEDLTSATNSIYAIAPAGRILARYDKAHLVPYGEYLPMRPLLSAIGLSRLVPGDIDFAPGPAPRTLNLPGFGPAAMQLCYEIVFSGEVVDRAHRPAFLFNPSNDAWFGAWGPPQHLAQARMRAIEEGLPVLRATPTGISAVIDAEGRVIASIPPGRRDAIELPLPAPLPPTLFARVGNGMAAIMAALLFVGAVALRRRRR